MKIKYYLIVSIGILTLVGCLNKETEFTVVTANNNTTSVENTYLGKIEFQDQTISKSSAKFLQKEIDLQRASQLVLWSLPITSFYQALS